jgi:acetyltransferase-like isoleucine patch superfamily enzyme
LRDDAGAKFGEIMQQRISTQWSLLKRLVAGMRHRINTGWWGMDIHASARIEPSVYLDKTWPKGVHIGPDCYIGEQAVVLTHDMTRGLYLDTYIGARCQIGPRAIVLPGLTVGEDCILMPGALVTKDLPANSIATGNPAKVEARAGAPAS